MPTLAVINICKPHKLTHKPKLAKEYACPTAQGHCKLDTTALRQKEGQLVTARGSLRLQAEQ